jgi:hypothetical protein
MHSILGWNQALIVALFGAGLVIVASGTHAGVAELAFGLVLPVLLIGGALAWAGEMIRMERTGAFLRALERSTWSRSADGSEVATSWFIWENFLWSPPDRIGRAGFHKQNSGYAGVAMYFAAAYVGSTIVFIDIAPWWLSLVDVVVLASIAVALLLPVVRHIFALGGLAPSISHKELSEWASGLTDNKSVSDQIAPWRTLAQLRQRSAGRSTASTNTDR